MHGLLIAKMVTFVKLFTYLWTSRISHSLNLANLDIKNNKISVIGKGKKPRTLHINDELIEILCQYLALRDQFCNSWLTPSLFVSKKGNRLAIRTMEDNLKKILLYVPFEVPFNISCHTLRHSMVYPPLEGFPSE